MKIEKIKIKNYRRFLEAEININDGVNVLVGNNEAGKSSILSAIDLTVSGSPRRVESLGIENIFNYDVCSDFIENRGRQEELPELYVELFLSDQKNPDFNGNDNSDGRVCDGIKMVCAPLDNYREYVEEVLSREDPLFPFEYYGVRFSTFSGALYSGYKKFLSHVLIDSSQINNEYATREYIKAVYSSVADPAQRNQYQSEYRKSRSQFTEIALSGLNQRMDGFSFSVRTGAKANLHDDLTIMESGIPLESRGKGYQSIIKTRFALNKKGGGEGVDLILLEEPENHLSHSNMKVLRKEISDGAKGQVVVSTHSSLVSSGLDLRNVIMLNSSSEVSLALKDISEDTAKFFMKAPDNNLLEFVLSEKVILVEGHAEFMLMPAFYENEIGSQISESGIHVIAVGGVIFKRYMEIARLLGIKTAVLRDNDGDPERHCVEAYKSFENEFIKVFFEKDPERPTLENCIYEDNKEMCDELFGEGRRTRDVLQYMLDEKTESAYQLVNKEAANIKSPRYIAEAIEWLRS